MLNSINNNKIFEINIILYSSHLTYVNETKDMRDTLVDFGPLLSDRRKGFTSPNFPDRCSLLEQFYGLLVDELDHGISVLSQAIADRGLAI